MYFFTTNATYLQAHVACWVCIGNSVDYLVVQPTSDVAYKLSDLVKRITSYKSPPLTFFEQDSYLVYMVNNIDYVLILSVSRSPSYCIIGRILSSTVLHIIL